MTDVPSNEKTIGKAIVVFGDALRNKPIVDELLFDGFDARKASNQEFWGCAASPGMSSC